MAQTEPTQPRTVAVAGAAGALARRTTERFAQHGWNLVLLARPHHEAELRERHPDAVVVGADLADPGQAERAVRAAEERFGAIDALLNLTGGFAMQSAVEVQPEDLDAQIEAHLKTVMFTTRAALPRMLERRQGFVLGVAAAQPIRGGARTSAYSAAKGAVLGYLRSLRSEVEPEGVAVSVLVPMGTIDTPANRDAMPKADPAKWIDPGELADAIHFLTTRSSRGRVAELHVHAR
ncbi:MAG TPA: SDR family oxidoreductase [Trueperaceae bacterium]|nr:SDR family oxidoreductase [Trueperaceae bacterium]